MKVCLRGANPIQSSTNGPAQPRPLARTYNYTYLSTSAYTNLNILNRVLQVTVRKPGCALFGLVSR